MHGVFLVLSWNPLETRGVIAVFRYVFPNRHGLVVDGRLGGTDAWIWTEIML